VSIFVFRFWLIILKTNIEFNRFFQNLTFPDNLPNPIYNTKATRQEKILGVSEKLII